MQLSSELKFIDIYHNSCDIGSLCKVLLHDLQTDFILISWYITEHIWYVPLIYDKKISVNFNTNNEEGWYISNTPCIYTIPAVHSTLNNYKTLTFQNKAAVIYTSEIEMSKIYLFILESYLVQIMSLDLSNRIKRRQEITLSNICHSIRTPLNGILHMTSNDTYLNQSALSLANSIFDIVDLTQLEIGKLKINKELFNLHTSIADIMSIANSLNKKKAASLECYIEPSVPKYIYSDIKRIKQIIINLLENAIQHTLEGEIALYVHAELVNLEQEDNAMRSSSSTQYNIIFTVQDTGTGMDEKTRSALFKPIEISCSTKQHGISLRISYLLAKKLEGGLSIVYSEPEKGSCFRFSMIAYEEEPPEIYSNTLKTLKSKNVLLIDSTPDRIDICKFMNKYEMIYNIANSYEEAAILHSEKNYDMLIVHATCFVESIRGKWPNVPILILTEDINLIPNGLDVLLIPADEQAYKLKLLENIALKKTVISPRKRLSILVVEDEQVNRIVMEKILRKLGYNRIDLANNPSEALKLVANNCYDLLLLDIRMPIMSGFELADKIYKFYNEKNKKCPKMLGITAQMVTEEDHRDYFNEFIYKPINIEELGAKIEKITGI